MTSETSFEYTLPSKQLRLRPDRLRPSTRLNSFHPVGQYYRASAHICMSEIFNKNRIIAVVYLLKITARSKQHRYLKSQFFEFLK